MDDFPLTPAELDRFRLTARKRSRARLTGAHLLRRRGQSLEFRDYAVYAPGDDFRHIDWRASARGGGERLVRTYVAEEAFTLAVSVDVRESMRLPQAAPKLRIACWLAYALAAIASLNQDRVLLHRLFGRPGVKVPTIADQRAWPRARGFLRDSLEAPADPHAEAGLQSLLPLLPPTACWVILTDLYFDDAQGALQRAIARAQDGLRWVIVVDLDSWPWERTALGLGPRGVRGPGLAGGEYRAEIDREGLEWVGRRIMDHKEGLRHALRRGGLDLIHWPWPDGTRVDPAAFFKERLMNDRTLQRLFQKES